MTYIYIYRKTLHDERRCIYFSIELTFAGIHAFKPPVISVSVAGTSAFLEPRTTGSATTDLAGFLEGAALETCHHTDDCGAD